MRRRRRRYAFGDEATEPVENAITVASADEPEPSLTEWLPVPYAQQVFSLVPAAAGVIAGLILAQKFAAAKATHVKMNEVLVASSLSFLASLVVVYWIRSFRSYSAPGEGEA